MVCKHACALPHLQRLADELPLELNCLCHQLMHD